MIRLGVFSFLNKKLEPFSVFKVALKLPLISKTFRSNLFSMALPFSVSELTSIMPDDFSIYTMIKGPLSILYFAFDLSLVIVDKIAVRFGYS